MQIRMEENSMNFGVARKHRATHEALLNSPKMDVIWESKLCVASNDRLADRLICAKLASAGDGLEVIGE